MWNSKKSIYLSIAVCSLLSVILLALVVIGPKLFEVYMINYRGLAPDGERLQELSSVFVYCFYPAAVFAGVMLYALLRLLFNLKAGDIFVSQNVKLLKLVSLCCFIVGAITFVGGIFYMPFFFASAAGGFTGILLRVLKNVMENAVEIRAENDLTI